MRNLLLSTAALLTLSGCAATEGPSVAALTPDKLIERVEARPTGALAPQAGYEALFVALPEGARASAASFTLEGDGAVATGVVITLGDSGVSLRADELRAYDLTPEALSAAEGAQLASRLDLRGVSFEGLGEVTADLSEGLTEGMVEGLLGEEEGFSLDQDIGRYDYAMERLVLDGFTVAALPTDAVTDGESDLFKAYLRLSSLFGADRFMATGVSGEMEMTQTTGSTITRTFDGDPNEGAEPTGVTIEPITTEMTTSFRIAEFGGADWNGYDFGMQFARGFESSTEQTMNGTPVPATDVRGEEIVIRDVSLSKVLPFLLSETMPGADATDLMSLGKWEMTNITTLMGGRAFSTTERASLDLSQWHGLMPERITYEATERLEVKGLIEMVRGQVDAVAAASAAEEGADAPDMAMLEAVATALREQGLETIRSQGSLDYAYAPDTGAMTLRTASDTEEMGSIAFDLDLGLPTYARFAGTPIGDEADAAGGNALSDLLAEEMALERMSLVMDDEGGLDAFLSVLIAVADATDPAEAGQLAMLQGQSPEQLRQMLAGLVTMSSVQAAAMVPQATDFAGALSGWLSQGGELTIVLDPETPVGAAALAEIETMEGGPAAIVDRLGITVQHEAAE